MGTMDIETRIGAKIKFSYPENGYGSTRETVDAYLSKGKTYTVERINIGGWSTSVYLEEVPGIGFNSVLFENLELGGQSE